MIAIGNFFFKYRNFLFIFLYLLLFAPSPSLFTAEAFGENYYVYPLFIGLFVTISGELIRGITIGLAYIIRGGKDKKVYAEKLVTEGIFNHGRNPLYVGNILMLAGVGILSNSLLYVLVVIPGFLFIYQAIVLAEENFLRGKFGKDFDNYTQRVNRWIIDFRGIGQSVQAMKFNYRRWILKEYNTLLVWLIGISAIICLNYPQLFQGDDHRQQVFIVSVIVFGSLYLIVRYLKKSGKMTA